ncbi:hypothetical protein QYI97_01710 [Lacticaseibacillus paracasei]|uniref:hypothetical protein n=1 Tax=Lacticaseibacillus paracasei TaxID=1597 RepID=UPI0026235C72|nr:hypothetical protein [Lacticaseibacillus paracasei]MDN4552954.1 hypothetical protein [Lacticaseibacillus paracasei]
MKNREISIDIFSVLNSAGWLLTIANIAGITQLSWLAILNYWLALFGIALTMGISYSIIGLLVHKGGNNSAQ